MSVRTDLVQFFTGALPSGSFDVLPYTKNLKNIRLKKLTLMVRTDSYNPGPAATWNVSVSIFLVSPHENMDSAEDQLEDAVTDVLLNLDSTANIFNGARRAVIDETYLGYVFEADFPLVKDN